jgi:hypothetical protein
MISYRMSSDRPCISRVVPLVGTIEHVPRHSTTQHRHSTTPPEPLLPFVRQHGDVGKTSPAQRSLVWLTGEYNSGRAIHCLRAATI